MRQAITTFLRKAWQRPTFSQASCCSLLIHAGVLSALLVQVSDLPDRFEIDGRRNAIQVTVLAAPQTQPAEEQPDIKPPEEPVEVVVAPTAVEPAMEFVREMEMRPAAPPRSEELSPSARNLQVARNAKPPAPERSATDSQAKVSKPDAVNEIEPASLKRVVQQAEPRKPALKQAKQPTPRPKQQVAVTLAAQPAVEVPQIAGVNDKTPPDFAGNPSPTYPPEAIRRRLQGTVLLELEVSETGQVQSVSVLRSSGHSILDQSALRTVRNWRGRPATQSNRAVATVESIPIRFRLGD